MQFDTKGLQVKENLYKWFYS